MVTELNDFSELPFSDLESMDELTRTAGWRVLLASIENSVGVLEEQMGRASDPLMALQYLRTWQIYRAFYFSLRQNARLFQEQVEKQREMAGPEGEYLRQMQSLAPKFGVGRTVDR